jgi:hypothetical protein
MNRLPAVRWLLRVLLNPGWAPLSVVALHLALAELGLTQRFDHLLHFLGGASMAYFLHGLIARLPLRVAGLPRWVHFLLAFTSACTVALFWEFAEFASDQLRGTSIQQSLSETMLDLLFGVLGATGSLLIIAGLRLMCPRCACRESVSSDGAAKGIQPLRTKAD